MTVVYHPSAVEELSEAAAYYDARLHGLGKDFLEAIDQAVTKLQAAPKRFAIVQDDIRRCTLSRFPYAIYYRTTGDLVRVLVIRHHARHPDYGLDRG